MYMHLTVCRNKRCVLQGVTLLLTIVNQLLDIPRQPTCIYEARYWTILSAYTILRVQAAFIHVICLGISNKYVAYPDRTAFALT